MFSHIFHHKCVKIMLKQKKKLLLITVVCRPMGFCKVNNIWIAAVGSVRGKHHNNIFLYFYLWWLFSIWIMSTWNGRCVFNWHVKVAIFPETPKLLLLRLSAGLRCQSHVLASLRPPIFCTQHPCLCSKTQCAKTAAISCSQHHINEQARTLRVQEPDDLNCETKKC